MSPTLSVRKPSPFAIPISFTANYPLETCRLILLNSQVIPNRFTRFFGAPQMTFELRPVSTDIYEFHAEQKFGTRGTAVIARGLLEDLNDQTTKVTGYADIPIWSYIALALLFFIGFPASMWFYSGTTQTLLFKVGFAVLFFGGTVILNLILVRTKVKKLSRTIETKLTSG